MRDGMPPSEWNLPPGVRQRDIDEANQGDPYRCPNCGRLFEDLGPGDRVCPRCGWSDEVESIVEGHGFYDQDAAEDDPLL